MPQWNLKRPLDTFPVRFFELMQAEPGEYVVQSAASRDALDKVRDDFCLFRSILRRHPEHPLAQAMFTRNTRFRTTHRGEGGRWTLSIKITMANEVDSAVMHALGFDSLPFEEDLENQSKSEPVVIIQTEDYVGTDRRKIA